MTLKCHYVRMCYMYYQVLRNYHLSGTEVIKSGSGPIESMSSSVASLLPYLEATWRGVISEWDEEDGVSECGWVTSFFQRSWRRSTFPVLAASCQELQP